MKDKLNEVKEALGYASRIFKFYERHHKNKGDVDSLNKAKANHQHAVKMDKALTALNKVMDGLGNVYS